MINIFENYPDVVTIEQLQEMLGVGRNTAYRLIKDNKIKSFTIGRKYKIPKSYVINFILSDN